jgi:DNA-binding transcriptional ArsR family regulator
MEYNVMIEAFTAESFAALADPNRLRIVGLLREGPKPVGLIAQSLTLNQPQVSKHLNVLKKARLVEVEARAQQRLYRIDAAGFRSLHDWLESYRRLWDARFDHMDAVIADMLRNEKD